MIYLSEVRTPLGPLGIAECKERFVAVWAGGVSPDRLLDLGLTGLGELRVAEERPLSRRFSEFLAGGPRGRFTLDLSLAGGPLERKVYRTLFRTRPGDRLELSELAAGLGPSSSVAAVEGAILRNPLLGIVPSHRVQSGGLPLGTPDDQAWANYFSKIDEESTTLELS